MNGTTRDSIHAQTQAHVRSLSDVSATALLTLFARARAAQGASPILSDPVAQEWAATLSPLLDEHDRLHRFLLAGRIPARLVLFLGLRARRYDAYATDFLHRHPHGVIVNLGCGLDTRFARLDAAAAHTGGGPRVVEVDLPPMIALKRTLAEPHPRHHLIAASVLDSTWMDEIDRYDDRRFLFLAEGLFMYFAPEEVKSLVLALLVRFPGSELVCEVFHRVWTQPPFAAWVAAKLRRELALGPDARFRFGISASRELEQWHPDLQFLDDWSFLDETDPRLGVYRLLGRVDWIRRIQWNVHYRLG